MNIPKDLSNIGNALKVFDGYKTGIYDTELLSKSIEGLNGNLLEQTLIRNQLRLGTAKLSEEELQQVLVTKLGSEERAKSTAAEIINKSEKLAGLAVTNKKIIAEVAESTGLAKNTIAKAVNTAGRKLGTTATEAELIAHYQNTLSVNSETAAKLAQIPVNMGLVASIRSITTGLAGNISALMTAHPIMTAIGVAIVAVTGIYSSYKAGIESANNALETQSGKVNSAKSNFEDLKGKIESTEEQLAETRDRISELQAKGALSLVEQTELEKLQAVNRELEITKSLLEVEMSQAQTQLSTEARALREELNKAGPTGTDWIPQWHEAGLIIGGAILTAIGGTLSIFGVGVPVAGVGIGMMASGAGAYGVRQGATAYSYQDKDIDNNIKKYKEAKAAIDAITDAKEKQKKLDEMGSAEQKLVERLRHWQEVKADIEALEIVGPEDLKALNEANDAIEAIYKTVNETGWKESEFNKLLDRAELQYVINKLKELSASGKLDSSTVESYVLFNNILKELGITAEEVVLSLDKITNNIPSLARGIVNDESFDINAIVNKIEGIGKDYQTANDELKKVYDDIHDQAVQEIRNKYEKTLEGSGAEVGARSHESYLKSLGFETQLIDATIKATYKDVNNMYDTIRWGVAVSTESLEKVAADELKALETNLLEPYQDVIDSSVQEARDYLAGQIEGILNNFKDDSTIVQQIVDNLNKGDSTQVLDVIDSWYSSNTSNIVNGVKNIYSQVDNLTLSIDDANQKLSDLLNGTGISDNVFTITPTAFAGDSTRFVEEVKNVTDNIETLQSAVDKLKEGKSLETNDVFNLLQKGLINASDIENGVVSLNNLEKALNKIRDVEVENLFSSWEQSYIEESEKLTEISKGIPQKMSDSLIESAKLELQKTVGTLESGKIEKLTIEGKVEIKDLTPQEISDLEKTRDEIQDLWSADWYESVTDAQKKSAIERLKNLDLEKISWQELKGVIDTLFESNAELFKTLDKLNKQLDDIQSAYSSASNAIDEFNEKGYISVDTYQELLKIEPQYLSLLIDEQGNLLLTKDALIQVTEARINELAYKQASSLLDMVLSADNERDALSKLKLEIDDVANSFSALYYTKLRAIAIDYGTDSELYQETLSQLKAIEDMRQKAILGASQGGQGNVSKSSSKSSTLDKLLDTSKLYNEQLKDLEKNLEPIEEKIAKIQSELEKVSSIGDETIVLKLNENLIKAKEEQIKSYQEILSATRDFQNQIKTTFSEFESLELTDFGIAKYRQDIENQITTLVFYRRSNVNPEAQGCAA